MNDFEQKHDDAVENTADATAQHMDDPVQEEPTASEQTCNEDVREKGRPKTDPDGDGGFVHNDPSFGNKSRYNRGALVAIAVMLVTVLSIFGSFFGAWMAAKNLRPAGNQGNGSSAGTSDETHDGGLAQKPVLDSNITPPENATIIKKTASRTDADGDGRADIVYGADGEVLTSAGDAAMSVASVVAKVSASVVEITTETLVHSGYIGQYVTSGAGSGVIIAKEGYIVTNYHVISGANSITVRMSDGKEFAAALIGSDQETDIAILWINAKEYPLTVAELGASYDLVVGEDILAIGNPLGSLGGTVTDGMISATEREINVNGTDMTLLQVSAPINPGNSGGGLFNLAGELVGVVNAKMASEEIEGLGFAIPSDTVYAVACELISHGYVSGRPALGVTLVEVGGMAGQKYLRVEDSNHAVLKNQDLILAADGTRVSSIEQLSSIVRGKSVGDTITLTVYRDGKEMDLIAPVIERGARD